MTSTEFRIAAHSAGRQECLIQADGQKKDVELGKLRTIRTVAALP
jgi:hypothetical protein